MSTAAVNNLLPFKPASENTDTFLNRALEHFSILVNVLHYCPSQYRILLNYNKQFYLGVSE